MKSLIYEYYNINNLFFGKSNRFLVHSVRSILLIMNLFIFNISLAQNGDNKGEQLYNKCRNLSIQMLQNNDNSVSQELSDSLYNLAMTDVEYYNLYNTWQKNYVENLKKGIKEDLYNLESQKQEATKARQDSYNTMLNNVSENAQNKSAEIQNNGQAKKKSGSGYRCDDCPAGTQR